MELTGADTAGGHTASPKPGPLAALILVVTLPATFIFANPIAVFRWIFTGSPGAEFQSDALLGLLVLAVGAGVIVAVGRASLGTRRTLVLIASTLAAFGLGLVVVIAVSFAQAFGDCNGGTSHPLTTPILIAGGVIYVMLGYLALRKGWWWAVPIAVVFALVFCFVLAQILPGVPNSTDPCSD